MPNFLRVWHQVLLNIQRVVFSLPLYPNTDRILIFILLLAFILLLVIWLLVHRLLLFLQPPCLLVLYRLLLIYALYRHLPRLAQPFVLRQLYRLLLIAQPINYYHLPNAFVLVYFLRGV